MSEDICMIILTQGCDSNLYGINCNESCGNCRNDDQCLNTNGTCLNGCADGYKGDLCKIREYMILLFMLMSTYRYMIYCPALFLLYMSF